MHILLWIPDSTNNNSRSGFCSVQNVSGRLVSKAIVMGSGVVNVQRWVLYPVSNRADNFPHRGTSNERLRLAHRVDLIERKSQMCLLFHAREETVSQRGGAKSDKRPKRKRDRLIFFTVAIGRKRLRGIIGNQWTSSGQPVGNRFPAGWRELEMTPRSMMRLPTLI